MTIIGTHLQIREFIVGELCYYTMVQHDVSMGLFKVHEIQKRLEKEEWYSTKMHIVKIMQVLVKLNDLLKRNATIQIDKGVIVVL